MSELFVFLNSWAGAIFISLFMVSAFVIIIGVSLVFAESYQKGNNTIANVTPIIDLNDEKGWYSKDNPLRLVHPHPEMKYEDIDWDCRLYGECDNNNETNITVSVIECPNNFTADNMTEYYECMGGSNGAGNRKE